MLDKDKDMVEHSKWKADDIEFIMSFDDKTGVERSGEDMIHFVRELQDVANKYDFDICHWGPKESMVDSFLRERDFIRKTLLKMLKDKDDGH